MIPHLNGRAEALAELGWTGRDAEWVALVCLHSGVFLRQQYLAFIGQTNPGLAARFVQRCGRRAAEEPWNGSCVRLCRLASRDLYRAVAAEHVRHRRAASPPVVLRRLLSLDYVIERLDAAWLPTETEKVSALTGAGVAPSLLPSRLYRGAVSAQRRYFAHKLPVALDAGCATFVYVLAEDETVSALRTWGEAHAALWSALRSAGREVETVVVGRDPERLAAAGRVLDAWASMTAAAAATEEIATIRTALVNEDLSALERYGGLNGGLSRLRALSARAGAPGGTTPAIASGSTWRSTRVPE